MKNFTYKLTISFIILTALAVSNLIMPKEAAFAQPAGTAGVKRFVSISPAMTEIMYALNADDMLKAVSDECSYPKEARGEEKIGSGYFINYEKILKIHPDYILALDSSELLVNVFRKFDITPLCFKYPDIQAVFDNILSVGKLTGKVERAGELVFYMNKKIASVSSAKKGNGKKVLYLISTRPVISAGKKSFINDIIEKSGMVSVTGGLNTGYPVISEEFIIKSKPDVIVLTPYADRERVDKLFPGAKIVRMDNNMNEIVNRPGPRVYQAVEYFSKL